MRKEHAKTILRLFATKCGCGAAATRFRTHFISKDIAAYGVTVRAGQSMVTGLDGHLGQVIESACDVHSNASDLTSAAPISEWRDYVFAEAVRELTTEAEG